MNSVSYLFRLKITSKTYFDYFLYSEYQLNLASLIESYVKVGLGYKEISNLTNDKGYRSNNGNLWNRMTVNVFMYKFWKSSRGVLSLEWY